MKKIFVTLTVAIMLISTVGTSASANSMEKIPEGNNFQDNLSNELIEKVEPYVEIEDKQFKLSNESKLKAKLSKDEYNLVQKKISEMNDVLKNQPNFEKVSGESAFQVELTDEELKNEINKQGNDYDLDASINDKSDMQLFAKSKNGINKVKMHIWGFEIWLSKTSVQNISNGGIATASLLISNLIPGVGYGILLAINAFVGGLFVSDNARAIYFKYGVVQGIHGFKYQ